MGMGPFADITARDLATPNGYGISLARLTFEFVSDPERVAQVDQLIERVEEGEKIADFLTVLRDLEVGAYRNWEYGWKALSRSPYNKISAGEYSGMHKALSVRWENPPHVDNKIDPAKWQPPLTVPVNALPGRLMGMDVDSTERLRIFAAIAFAHGKRRAARQALLMLRDLYGLSHRTAQPLISQIQIEQKGHIIKAVQWIGKEKRYKIQGTRFFLSEDTLKNIERQLQDEADKRIQCAIRQLRAERISVPQWKSNTLATLGRIRHRQIEIFQGGLDLESDWFQDSVHYWERRMFEADMEYLADLYTGLKTGHFGGRLNKNNFLERITGLYRWPEPVLMEFSPSHAKAKEFWEFYFDRDAFDARLTHR